MNEENNAVILSEPKNPAGEWGTPHQSATPPASPQGEAFGTVCTQSLPCVKGGAERKLGGGIVKTLKDFENIEVRAVNPSVSSLCTREPGEARPKNPADEWSALNKPSPLGEGGTASAVTDEGYAPQNPARSPFADFAEAFPDVAAKDVPREVWAAVERGQSLLSAYAMHENRRLRAELEAMRAAQSARERALPGSASVGGTRRRDAFLEGFLE